MREACSLSRCGCPIWTDLVDRSLPVPTCTRSTQPPPSPRRRTGQGPLLHVLRDPVFVSVECSAPCGRGWLPEFPVTHPFPQPRRGYLFRVRPFAEVIRGQLPFQPLLKAWNAEELLLALVLVGWLGQPGCRPYLVGDHEEFMIGTLPTVDTGIDDFLVHLTFPDYSKGRTRPLGHRTGS